MTYILHIKVLLFFQKKEKYVAVSGAHSYKIADYGHLILELGHFLVLFLGLLICKMHTLLRFYVFLCSHSLILFTSDNFLIIPYCVSHSI